MVNDCLFIDNSAVTTATAANKFAGGGAIATNSNLKVFDSIFKKNKAIAPASGFGGGGAIYASRTDVLVLSSVFKLNEATNVGGAAQFNGASVARYNNKELLFGNDALDCDGAKVVGERCFSVGENFSV